MKQIDFEDAVSSLIDMIDNGSLRYNRLLYENQ